MIPAALALALGLIVAGLVLVAHWAPPVNPDDCPLFEDIRRGWHDCPGPCTDERPLPCVKEGPWAAS